MTDWIDFAIYMLLLAMIWLVYPAAQMRLTLPLIAERNPDWLATHPDKAARLAGRRWPLWTGYILGGASLAALTAYQTGLWPLPGTSQEAGQPGWLILWNLAMASLMVSIAVGGTIGVINSLRLKRMVPLASQRRATLERRSIDDFVPRYVRIAVYLLVLANLAAWAAAAVLGLHSTPLFWSRIVVMALLSLFFWFMTGVSVARRPGTMDALFGPRYRRFEVRMTFATQITTPIIGAVRLYEEMNGTILFDLNRALQLMLALYIIVWLQALSRLAMRSEPLPAATNP